MIVNNKKIKRIHCIGIGGVGVGPLAAYLHEQGYVVSGSDCSRNNMTSHLQSLGVSVQYGHDHLLPDVDMVCYSSAISPENPQRSEASRRGIPVLKRAEVLAQCIMSYDSIAVTGTHGKTTTTAMCAHVLQTAKCDPSFMVGGLMQNTQAYMHSGRGEHFVLEADESDASFLCFKPNHIIVTNIEADHMETYGDMKTLKSAFLQFLKSLPSTGIAVLNGDDPVCLALASQLRCRVILFGFHHAELDFRASDMTFSDWHSHFNVKNKAGVVCPMHLSQPGLHNVANALATIAMLSTLGVSMELIQKAMATFQGVGRRLTLAGQFQFNGHVIPTVNDYGHHPTEVEAAIDTLRQVYPHKRLVMVFEPHRYTRTRDCFDAFVAALRKVDVLLLLDTYAASEMPIAGADSDALFVALQQAAAGTHQPVLQRMALGATLLAFCDQQLQADDVLLLQGAGSVGALPGQWQERLAPVNI